MSDVQIHTDGCCRPSNPGPGGWGVVLICDGVTKELAGAVAYSTNQRQELQAAIEALRALKRPCFVTLYTDSQYVQRGMTQWMPAWIEDGRLTNDPATSTVANADLWVELRRIASEHVVEWRWTARRGDTNPFTLRAEELAADAVDSLMCPDRSQDWHSDACGV